MKRLIMSGLCIVALAAQSFICATAQDVPAQTDDQWPLTINAQGVAFKVYQPQIDSWDGYILHVHCAIGANSSTDEKKISYGVASFTFNTIVDKDKRLVKFDKLQIDSVKFPSLPEQEQSYLNILRQAARFR